MSALLDLKEKIRTEALRLGFNHMGVAPAVPVPDYQHYQTWIEQGYHGTMGYLAREDAVQKRGNPELILKNCQRVISLAMPYRPPSKDDHQFPSGTGRISVYARTDDYHDQIWENSISLNSSFKQTATSPCSSRLCGHRPNLERSLQ